MGNGGYGVAASCRRCISVQLHTIHRGLLNGLDFERMIHLYANCVKETLFPTQLTVNSVRARISFCLKFRLSGRTVSRTITQSFTMPRMWRRLTRQLWLHLKNP